MSRWKSTVQAPARHRLSRPAELLAEQLFGKVTGDTHVGTGTANRIIYSQTVAKFQAAFQHWKYYRAGRC